MKKIMLLSIVAGMLFACGKSKPSRATVDDSEMKEIVLTNDSTIYIEEWVQDVEVIPLETSDKALVGSIDGVIVTDSNIILYDWRQTNSVFIFDRNGKHRATINRRGRGPQEYSSIRYVTLSPDNKTLAINDSRGKKVLYFSLDGRFISSIPTGFWFSTMEYLNENLVVCATSGTGESDSGLQEYENHTDLLYFTDREFGIKGSTMPLRYKSQVITTPNIWKWEDRIYVNRPYGDTIYQAMTNGLKAIYRIEMGKIDGMANLNSNISEEELELLQEKKTMFLGKFAENSHHIVTTVVTPPKGIAKNYLYSKQTGKTYAVEFNFKHREDVLLWSLEMPVNTSVKDLFATVIPVHSITSTGFIDLKTGVRTTAVTQRPELAHITEDSNPVVVLYSFKEGL